METGDRDASMEIENFLRVHKTARVPRLRLGYFLRFLGILSLVAGYFRFVTGSFFRVAFLLQFALSQPLSHNIKRKQGRFSLF